MDEIDGYHKDIFFHFWYIRDLEERKPRITICFAYDNNTAQFARGVAVCSQPDNPSKAIGRDLAAKRALLALKFRTTVNEKKVLMRRSKTFPKSLATGQRKRQILKYAPHFQMYMPDNIRGGEARFIETTKGIKNAG